MEPVVRIELKIANNYTTRDAQMSEPDTMTSIQVLMDIFSRRLLSQGVIFRKSYFFRVCQQTIKDYPNDLQARNKILEVTGKRLYHKRQKIQGDEKSQRLTFSWNSL